MLSLETLRLVLLILHFMGLAALIGPAMLRQLPSRRAVPVMLTGAVIQVITGNGLIAANQLQGMFVIEAKMILKLVIALAAMILLIIAAIQLRRSAKAAEQVQTNGLERAAAGFGVGALLAAVIWT